MPPLHPGWTDRQVRTRRLDISSITSTISFGDDGAAGRCERIVVVVQ
jgi:hypothetical protein